MYLTSLRNSQKYLHHFIVSTFLCVDLHLFCHLIITFISIAWIPKIIAHRRPHRGFFPTTPNMTGFGFRLINKFMLMSTKQFQHKNLKFVNKMNADQFAEWIKEKPCECSKGNYFTTSLTWESEDIEVKYKCDSCGLQFCRTYELSERDRAKRNCWGHYGKHQKISRNCAQWARDFYAKVTKGKLDGFGACYANAA